MTPEIQPTTKCGVKDKPGGRECSTKHIAANDEERDMTAQDCCHPMNVGPGWMNWSARFIPFKIKENLIGNSPSPALP